MILPSFTADDIYQLTAPAAPVSSSAPASAPAPTPVTMDVILGSGGQSAAWSADLDGTTLVDHERISQTNVPIGNTSTLSGMTLRVVGNIVDMPLTDNNLNLDFTVRGGVTTLNKSFTVVGSPGDMVRFLLRVTFL
jgi:hypothetical protein